ncbi:hypothetical protein Trydic_g16093 [Trypoxylus dichotomus]
MIKLARESNHLTFLCKARQFKIVLKGLKITLPVSSNRAKRIANRASEALVRERINYHKLAKIRMTQECEIKQKIGETVNEEDFTNICAAVQRNYTRINGQLKDKHRKKLKSLICQLESN